MSRALHSDGGVVGEWWRTDATTGRIICDLCPRECHLKDGDRGFCFVRENRGGEMILSTYGRSTGFCIDPIEKKPLNHFYPGTSVLSFGTAGCNLGCKFCQNWEISKSREVERLSQLATPEAIALAARELGCRSVAFTYNDPVIWAEYAIDTAIACRENGIKSVAVTAGYIHPSARKTFYESMDAANVDLKGFTEEFYWKTTNSHLAPVLDTLKYLKHETNVWFEITNLMIPQTNDNQDDVKRMADWIIEYLGPDVPIHFTAFHPDFRMRELPNTPIETLIGAYEIAKKAGIHYVYVGNVHDAKRQSTYCPSCDHPVIERDWYVLGEFAIDDGCCQHCRGRIAGCFDQTPGNWGNRRQPVDLTRWSRTSSLPVLKKEPTIMNAITSPPIDSILDADSLTEVQRQSLLQLAARCISQFAHGKALDVVEYIAQNELEPLLDQKVFGLFTTLKRGSQLRGCCGSIGTMRSLGESLLNACHRTTLEDRRMPAISPSELPYLSLDISLLKQLEPIHVRGTDRLHAFEIGKHGLHIERGEKGGLLLPSVSIEQGWDAEAFLKGVCRKAGLGEDDWMESDCKLNRFAGSAIHGSIDASAYDGMALRRTPLLTPDQLKILHRSVANNLMALRRGATPSYFIPDAPDGTVNGLVLSLFEGATQKPLLHAIRVSLRPGIPMQSSLFELTTEANHAIQNLIPTAHLQIELALTVLLDPSAHGSVVLSKSMLASSESLNAVRKAIGIEGIVESGRAIIAMVGEDRIAVSLAPNESPEEQIVASAKVLNGNSQPLAIFTMDAISTRSQLLATNVAIPKSEPTDRKPAVAGAFYPAEDAARRAVVKKIFDELPPKHIESPESDESDHEKSGARHSLLAIMTPHAGLTYSGKIAAMVWREVDFPRRLLIIGPKHTPHGVAWAVSPCRSWMLSDSVHFENDLELVEKLVENVEDLQMDAAAHHREHGIEIQLPLLEHLCPTVKLAAIAMHGATWPTIQATAVQLASILADDPDPPLLVISSDMNHYAEDSENRRLDRLALDAIHAKDPKKLIEVCHQNQISMCGLIPAALVMQTLSELGVDYQVQEIAYATSGDVTKSDKVVGYAGLTFSAKSR
ncbi:MAG: AmmeMemoRadiSam system radical SAM enzyme [Pirellulaceae bacterium]|nr:AmmeMemoRadiSam system radical SAM enzyme [Pirellulaceae bacterium]